jgi:hypothetical protein
MSFFQSWIKTEEGLLSMCVKIIGPDTETKYDVGRPLEDQVCGSQKVVIDYNPLDPDINTFVCEMERLRDNGISADVKVDFLPNNFMSGMKVKNQVKKLTKDLNLNEVIKLLTVLQNKTDKALEELSSFCHKENIH